MMCVVGGRRAAFVAVLLQAHVGRGAGGAPSRVQGAEDHTRGCEANTVSRSQQLPRKKVILLRHVVLDAVAVYVNLFDDTR